MRGEKEDGKCRIEFSGIKKMPIQLQVHTIRGPEHGLIVKSFAAAVGGPKLRYRK